MGRLELVVYAHSIDCGKKGYGNLVQLAELQSHVAARLGKPVSRLTMILKSAHIYETELVLMGKVLEAANNRRKTGGFGSAAPLDGRISCMQDQ